MPTIALENWEPIMLARILFHYFNTLYLNKTITTPEKLKTHQAKQFEKLIKNCLH
ncbi:CoF synthetase, partial [Legionella pneumophila]